MEREPENSLSPTLWRTARALANPERLALLRAAVASGGTTDVSRLAENAGLARSTASGYLRMLNARGLLAVDRRDGRVFYGPGTDRSLPVAAAVQKSFVRYVQKPDLPRDWIERALPSIRAFSHFRRLALLEDLIRYPGLSPQNLAAYAVFTNRQSTTIQKQEAFRKIASRTYVPRGFLSAVLLYRYPNGNSFVVTDVASVEDVFYVSIRKGKDIGTKTLIIPKSESEVAVWKKGRSITSRDWMFAAPVYPSPISSIISTSGSQLYRSLAEFRSLHPGAEDVVSP